MVKGPVRTRGTTAAQGERAALPAVLEALAEGDTPSWDALLEATDASLWQAVLQVAAHPPRARRGAVRAGNAQHAAEILFTVPRDGAGERVRRQVLLDGLGSADSALRAKAAELLGQLGDEDPLVHLAPLIVDANDHVRAAAVRELAQLHRLDALPLLLQTLERRDIVAAEAVAGLIDLGGEAVPALVGELQSGSSWTRWHAAKALGSIRDTRAIEPLLAALTDENASVRWQARYALVQFGTAVIMPLLEALSRGPVTPWFAAGADHVLRRVATPNLQAALAPLRAKLGHLTASVEVPVEAFAALQALQAAG